LRLARRPHVRSPGAALARRAYDLDQRDRCSSCNLKKGNKTSQEAGMRPSQIPFQPSVHHLHRNGRLFPPNYLHHSWLDYLYWDTELDP
jgi:hypothetical protein